MIIIILIICASSLSSSYFSLSIDRLYSTRNRRVHCAHRGVRCTHTKRVLCSCGAPTQKATAPKWRHSEYATCGVVWVAFCTPKINRNSCLTTMQKNTTGRRLLMHERVSNLRDAKGTVLLHICRESFSNRTKHHLIWVRQLYPFCISLMRKCLTTIPTIKWWFVLKHTFFSCVHAQTEAAKDIEKPDFIQMPLIHSWQYCVWY